MVQRVSQASVTVDDEVVSGIGLGLLVLLGVRAGDGEAEVRWMADKLANLRIFSDDEGKMNLSVSDVEGEVLVVSQFTLYGDARKGRRPSFVEAARPVVAKPMVTQTADALRALGLRVGEGVFGASMRVELTNEGPVTILLDTPVR